MNQKVNENTTSELLDALERIALVASATVCNTAWIARHAREVVEKARSGALNDNVENNDE